MVAALFVALLATAGAAATDPAGAAPAAASTPFPAFESVGPNVEFWTRVYGEWSLGQAAVHDMEHLGVVYEVVDLPGPVEERYTERQRDFLEQVNETWQDRLKLLARKVAAGEALDDDEKAWALTIATKAGSGKLAEAHKRVRTQRGLRERFRRGIEIGHRYDSRIRAILRESRSRASAMTRWSLGSKPSAAKSRRSPTMRSSL